MNDKSNDVDAGMVARSQALADRKARARTVASSGRVRVLPRDETIRRHITHQPSGIAFPAEGSVEWPNDRFTQRRISDGDVMIEGAEEKKKSRPEERKPSAPSAPTTS
jgi:hypothetical protein